MVEVEVDLPFLPESPKTLTITEVEQTSDSLVQCEDVFQHSVFVSEAVRIVPN